MEQWQAYNDPAGAGGQRRYNNGSGGNNNVNVNVGAGMGVGVGVGSQMQMSPRDYGPAGGPNPAQHPPAGFKYDNYQGGLNPHQSSSSAATSPLASPHVRDGNGDVSMQDSHDPYSSAKYPMRPHHQHHLSSSGFPTAKLLQQEPPSAAAQRYSPMEVLSPTSPYGSKAPAPGQFSQQPVQRQSPTRASDHAPQQSPYYTSSRQAAPQLPPISPYASGQDSYSPLTMTPMDGSYADPKSPKRAPMMPPDKGPVPELRRIRAPTDLKPKVNAQPAFRRANPEGGFISVSCLPTCLRYPSPIC